MIFGKMSRLDASRNLWLRVIGVGTFFLVPLCEHLANCVDNEARLVEWNIF